MKPVVRLRIGLDLLAALLLVFALSYWWLGNLAHELAGTLLFLLLIVHNAFNRRWYGSAARRRGPRNRIDLAATGCLLVCMVALLLTSVLIADSLAGTLPFGGGYTARQLHVAAAYWGVILVSVHLGMRWTILMGFARRLFRIDRSSRARTLALRTGALAIMPLGVWSSCVLDLGAKLVMSPSLEWWDFETSTAGFFFHWLSVIGFYAVLSHYLTVVAIPKGQSMLRRDGAGRAIRTGQS